MPNPEHVPEPDPVKVYIGTVESRSDISDVVSFVREQGERYVNLDQMITRKSFLYSAERLGGVVVARYQNPGDLLGTLIGVARLEENVVTAKLENLTVHEDFRGPQLGIAGKLIRTIGRVAWERGHTELCAFAESDEDRHPDSWRARNYTKRYGFNQEGGISGTYLPRKLLDSQGNPVDPPVDFDTPYGYLNRAFDDIFDSPLAYHAGELPVLPTISKEVTDTVNQALHESGIDRLKDARVSWHKHLKPADSSVMMPTSWIRTTQRRGDDHDITLRRWVKIPTTDPLVRMVHLQSLEWGTDIPPVDSPDMLCGSLEGEGDYVVRLDDRSPYHVPKYLIMSVSDGEVEIHDAQDMHDFTRSLVWDSEKLLAEHREQRMTSRLRTIG